MQESRHQDELRERKERQERQRLDVIKQKKKKIENKAMKLSEDYELKSNNLAIDISTNSLGYDIKSSNDDVTKFIEVKGKSEIGDVLLTKNEWEKAKELENNYFIYIFTNLGDDNYSPRFYRIQSPTNEINPIFDEKEQKYRITSDMYLSFKVQF